MLWIGDLQSVAQKGKLLNGGIGFRADCKPHWSRLDVLGPCSNFEGSV